MNNNNSNSDGYLRKIFAEDFELSYFRELYETAKANVRENKTEYQYLNTKRDETFDSLVYWQQAVEAIEKAVPEVLEKEAEE